MEHDNETGETAAEWQLVLCVGDTTSWAGKLGDACVPITAGIDTLDTITLTAADLRARAVVTVEAVDSGALVVWAYLSGLAGRVLDVLVRDRDYYVHVESATLAAEGRSVECERPESRVEQYSVGTAAAAGGTLDPEANSGARWAKRVSVEWVPGAEMYQAAARLSGLRDRRGDGGRLPQVSVAEHAIDLEGIRLRGAAHRRSTNAATDQVLAEADAPTARQRRLIKGASRPIEEVLGLLGCGRDEDLWNCPRPERHTHGDAVPSMRAGGNAVRCFRCDSEWSDPLRLIMDTTALGPDDAADLLIGDDSAFEPWRARILAERAARAGG